MTGPHETPRVLIVGEVNPDIVVLDVPDVSFGQREDFAGPVTMTIGSSAAITACGLARLGTRTGLVGVVGEDAFANFMLKALEERQVNVERVRTVPRGRTGSSVILVRRQDSSDRHILTDAGVMGELCRADLDLAAAGSVEHVHVSSWFLHTGLVADLPGLLAAAKERGMSTSVDPNDDPNRTWRAHLPEALAYVDTFFCNESEARGIAGSLGGAATADSHQAARVILDHLAPGGRVVLKAGAAGAYLHTVDGVVHVAAPQVQVVDTVGAGDTLAAGYMHAILRGADAADALRLGVAAGSLSTGRSGGVVGQPELPEAETLAEQLTAVREPSAAPSTTEKPTQR